MNARDLILTAEGAELCQPWPRRVLSLQDWMELVACLASDTTLDLIGMWADTVQVHALFQDAAAGDALLASVAVESGHYPALSPARPVATWFERMIRDLWGHSAADGLDHRPWLDHGHWPATPPLAARPLPSIGAPEPAEFLASEGVDDDHPADVHQIPVGPVHAGIIEPGHFRFTASGETIVRLEIRLGYLHKGTLGLLRGKSPRAAARFAARVSGDSTVAHSLAFAHAAEAACAVEPPPRAVVLRAMMGEIERVANHLGDSAGIITDAGFPLRPARFAWHREALLRATEALFGHRLMMDAVVPGGIAADFQEHELPILLRVLDGISTEMPGLIAVYDDTPSLADRMLTTGRLLPELAGRYAVSGVIGRAVGRVGDVRVNPGYAPFDRIGVEVPVQPAGDVDARVRVRLAEIDESLHVLRVLAEDVPQGATAIPLPQASGEGLGWAEGFRGDIWHWLRIEAGLITQGFLCDPSWRQWPLLQAAVEGNIVADFPLCNKSFNCSYSGVDL